MPCYEINMDLIVACFICVEADSEQEALEKANREISLNGGVIQNRILTNIEEV